MDWDGIGLTADVLSWLDATGIRTATKERRLDPFATSMRDFDDVTPNLEAASKKQANKHTDPTQRVADLRSAALVETVSGTATLTKLGEAVLAEWKVWGVANAVKSDETARTLIVYGLGRRIGTGPYPEFFRYWSELRAVFDPVELIDSWDALFTLNYLDHRIDDFAPGDAFRDDAVPVGDIEFDLDQLAVAANAVPRARKGAAQVKSGIQGKIPRGKARATACLSMELLLRPAAERTALLARFGLPKKPRLWAALDGPSRKRILQIAASLDPAGVVAPAALPAASPMAGAAASTINFGAALKPVPKPAKKKGGKANGGPKKTDYKRRQERNGEIGRLGEEFAIAFERWRLSARPDLAAKVKQVSLHDDTLGYDIKSFDLTGGERLVEVKATEGPLSTRFFLSSNEHECALANQSKYVVLRVGNLRSGPVCCEVRPPFDELDLKPAVFECTFKPAP